MACEYGLRGAVFDRARRYRYLLWRAWDAALARATFIMLNPSTADARRDDATIRACIRLARAWSFGGIEVVNLFAFRARDPRALLSVRDPVGPRNDALLRDAAMRASRLVCAWGCADRWLARVDHVRRLIAGSRALLVCLGRTRNNHPRHPLYVRSAAPLIAFAECDAADQMSTRTIRISRRLGISAAPAKQG
ncbi:MAG: DUF1643 domain-containing protein [Phycisphaerae bacterium]